MLIELQDGSNCETAGDLLCDTPPDYGVGFTCGCCRIPFPIRDSKCDTITSHAQNVMSYSVGCDEFEFTEDQITAMQASYMSPQRAYLRTNITESVYRPVTDRVTTISPAAFETVEVFNDVLFEWEPVTNAEFYTITINGEDFRSTEPQFRMTGLEPGTGFNSYSVQAFGPFGGGCAGADQIIFNTGNTSSTNELDFVDGISVFPNPVSNSQDLNIVFDSAASLNGEVILYNMTGQIVSKTAERISASTNNFRISTQNLDQGLYLSLIHI